MDCCCAMSRVLSGLIRKNTKNSFEYLLKSKLQMKKFPLCIKESGGNFERGQDKTKFGEKLSESNDENSAAYTIKLNDIAITIIRKFEL